MNDLILKCESELAEAIAAIQQPRPAFVLRHFVVGQHDTPGQQWAQCILEMQLKLQAIATAEIDRQLAELRLARLEKRGTRAALLKAEKVRIELRSLEWAKLGAERELASLLQIKESFGRNWTREELDEEQEEYWNRRLARQAMQDVNGTGRVGVGNQDALRMIGRPIAPADQHVGAVERRFLETGAVKLVVVVATLISRARIVSEGLRCLAGWDIPRTIERQVHVVTDRPTADAYNEGVQFALKRSADFVLCVEDDHEIVAGTFEKLWSLYLSAGPRVVVGAWYPQKQARRTGAPIVLSGGRREYLSDDGDVHEVYSIPQGFTLIPTTIFREIPQPWFATTGCLTQDSFFSQLAREAGYKLLVDTSARIRHVCRQTSRVYE